MTRRKEYVNPKKSNLLFLSALLLVWFLNTLGSFARKVTIKFFSFLVYYAKVVISFYKKAFFLLRNFLDNKFSSISFPKITLPKLSINFSFPKFRFGRPQVLNTSQLLEIKKLRGRPKKTKSFFIKILQGFNNFLSKIFPKPVRIAVLILIVFSAVFFYSYGLVKIAKNLPSPNRLANSSSPATTEIFDRKGRLLYRIYEGKNRVPITLDKLPDNLINATIAVEDKNFYIHPGIDGLGILRALKANIEHQQIQGGSTLTQQLIKNTLLTPDRTFKRKVTEIALAFWTERIFSKQQILEMYFNEVPYGGPAWGIAAAAQTYYNKDVKDLTLAESAYLAGLPASPTTYSPYGTNPELGKQRQKEVLRRMVEDGYIDQKQADEAFSEQLEIKSPISQIKAPHFVMYVRQLLAEKYGDKVVSQGGLKVTTSLDLDLQNMAELAVSEEVAKLSGLNVTNGAAMINDAKTGQILAMVGSKNYFDEKTGNFNVATALRQPGSSIKPVTYATAFKQGYTPGNILLDTPVTFKNDWETYSPVNYDGKFHGPVTIRTALGSSYNIPAVKTLAMVGIPNMIQTAKDMGITTFGSPDQYGLSVTLGGAEVKLVDMMTVFGTLSQMGVKKEPQPILKVTDANGVILEDNIDFSGKQVLSKDVAYMINDILSDNRARTPAFGPNSLLNVPGHTVAVKTGTTDNKKDNWTLGFTPEIVVGVWVGNNDGQPMNPQLTSGVTGAAPIWNRIMTNILQDRPDIAFEKPADIVAGIVDNNRDFIISGQSVKSVVGFGKKTVKDDKSPNPNKDKEVITFTDPFSSFTQDTNTQTELGR